LDHLAAAPKDEKIATQRSHGAGVSCLVGRDGSSNSGRLFGFHATDFKSGDRVNQFRPFPAQVLAASHAGELL